MRENGAVIYQQASPLDCHIRQSAAACQGLPLKPLVNMSLYTDIF